MSKIALPIAELKPALTGLGRIIGRKNSLPVLNHILAKKSPDGWITLTANNLEQCATVRLEQPAEGEPCSMLIPFEELQKTAKTLAKSDTIVFEPASKESVILHYPIGGQTMQRKIETISVEEFPFIPRIQGDSVPLPDGLRTSLLEAFECSSEESNRLILNGAFIDVSDAKCHNVVGTNGKILYGSNSFSLPLQNSIVVPRHHLLEWKEFNSDGEWQLKVEAGAAEQPPFQISSRRWTFISRQIQGTYPNWRAVVPKVEEFKTTIILDERVLDSIIQIIDRLPNYDETNFTIGLRVEGKRVCLMGKPIGNVPWTEVNLTFNSAKGNDVKILLNRSNITTALRFGLNRIDITDHMSPIRMSNGGKQMIIMPVRADGPAPAAEVKASPDRTGAVKPEPVKVEPTAEPEPEPEPEPAVQAPAKAPQPEESKTMINEINGTSATTPSAPAEEPAPMSDLDQVLETIEDLRESLSVNLSDLKVAAGKLKQIRKEQKATEKEIQSFKQTLRNLQGVKL